MRVGRRTATFVSEALQRPVSSVRTAVAIRASHLGACQSTVTRAHRWLALRQQHKSTTPRVCGMDVNPSKLPLPVTRLTRSPATLPAMNRTALHTEHSTIGESHMPHQTLVTRNAPT